MGMGQSSAANVTVNEVSEVWGKLLYLVEYRGPYVSPALRSMISRSGPRSLVNAWASNAATLSFGFDGSERTMALTVAARGARRRRDSSGATDSQLRINDKEKRARYLQSNLLL